jgi:FkbM family methyltransferase
LRPLHKLDQIRDLKHSLYQWLNKPGFRWILATWAAVMASIRVRGLCSVSYEGEWVQKFPLGTLVEPRLTLWTPQEIERHTIELYFHQYLPGEGDTIIDIGAGTGWETLSFSRIVGSSGRVISVEAHPITFRCLSKTCEKNRLQNVTLIQAAIGDREREVLLSNNDEHEANLTIGVQSGVRVPGTTLDNIFRSLALSQVDYLKMNIEGAEGPALSGMAEMVQKTRHVCISCHDFLADDGGPNELRTKADVIRFLKQNGFAVSLRESDVRSNVRCFVYGLNQKFVGNNSRRQTNLHTQDTLRR